jgi:hypothetical protein
MQGAGIGARRVLLQRAHKHRGRCTCLAHQPSRCDPYNLVQSMSSSQRLLRSPRELLHHRVPRRRQGGEGGRCTGGTAPRLVEAARRLGRPAARRQRSAGAAGPADRQQRAHQRVKDHPRQQPAPLRPPLPPPHTHTHARARSIQRRRPTPARPGPGPQDFASLQLDEIGDNITARRNRIFLLMEEVRRLRIQQRLKVGWWGRGGSEPGVIMVGLRVGFWG